MSQYFTEEMKLWAEENANKHLCKCGCGQFVQPFVWRWRHGKNLDYVNHHYKRKVGLESPSWRGGQSIVQGYVLVFRPEHPHANNNGYVFEHRLVVEQAIGRILDRSEIVHHINGTKTDNRLENLQVLSVREHHELHCGNGSKHVLLINLDEDEIRDMREKGNTMTTVAARLNVSRQTISRRLKAMGIQ